MTQFLTSCPLSSDDFWISSSFWLLRRSLDFSWLSFLWLWIFHLYIKLINKILQCLILLCIFLRNHCTGLSYFFLWNVPSCWNLFPSGNSFLKVISHCLLLFFIRWLWVDHSLGHFLTFLLIRVPVGDNLLPQTCKCLIIFTCFIWT